MNIPVVWLLLTTLGALAAKFKTSLRETIPSVVPIVQNSVPVDNHRSFKKIFTRDEAVQSSKRPSTRPPGLGAHWWHDFDGLRTRNIRMKQEDKIVIREDKTTKTKKSRSRKNVDAGKAARNKNNSRLHNILLSRSQKRNYFDMVEQLYTRDKGKHAHYGHKYRRQDEKEAGDVPEGNENNGVGVDAAAGRDEGNLGDGDVGDGGEDGYGGDGGNDEIDAEQKEEEDGAEYKPKELNNDGFNDLDNNEDTNNHKTNDNNHEDDITQHRNQGSDAELNDDYFFISQSEKVLPDDNNIKLSEEENAQEDTHSEPDLKTTDDRGQNRDKGGTNDSDDDDDDDNDFDLQNYYDPPQPPAAVHGSYGPGGGIGSIGSISNMLHSGVMHNQWINIPPRQKKRGKLKQKNKLKGKNRGRGRHQRLNSPGEQPWDQHKSSHTKTKKLSGTVKSDPRLCVLNTYSEYCIGAGGGGAREAPARARQRPEDPYKPVTVPGFIPKDEYNKKQKDKLAGLDTHTLILKL